MKPIFKTSSNSQPPAASPELQKSPAAEDLQSDSELEADVPHWKEVPHVPGTGTLYVEPRIYSSCITVDGWCGTNACLVRDDRAGARLKDVAYGSEYGAPLAKSSNDVLSIIRKCLGKTPMRFTLKKTVKRQSDNLKKWLTLGVYSADYDPRIFLVDMGLGPPPDVLYVGRGRGPVSYAVDAPALDDVTYIVGRYKMPSTSFETQLRKQLAALAIS